MSGKEELKKKSENETMRVVVVGASRGLGLCLCETFARHGHQVWAAAREPEKAKQLLELCRKYENLTAVAMDVSSWISVKDGSRDIVSQTHYLDLVICNAGILYPSDFDTPIMETDPDILSSTMAVNTEGPILVLKGLYPLLQKSSRPKYYVITSEGTMTGSWDKMPVYSLSKVAANKAVSIMRASLDQRFQVLAVHPGRMDTDMGHESAQIKPEEAAGGIYALAAESVLPASWYVDYNGKKMQL